MPVRIIVISGPCGTGKTSTSRVLAETAPGDRAVAIHTDDFYRYIRKGYIAPWLDGSGDQNETVIEAAAACARQYAVDGYEVYVDGTIGPWFLAPWRALTREGIDVRYVVLRPDESTTVSRATVRAQREEFPLTTDTIQSMWRLFADLGAYEAHAVDTGGLTVGESATCIQRRLEEGDFRITP